MIRLGNAKDHGYRRPLLPAAASYLDGGYDLQALGNSVAAHVATLMRAAVTGKAA
jgi:hypothetical protein